MHPHLTLHNPPETNKTWTQLQEKQTPIFCSKLTLCSTGKFCRTIIPPSGCYVKPKYLRGTVLRFENIRTVQISKKRKVMECSRWNWWSHQRVRQCKRGFITDGSQTLALKILNCSWWRRVQYSQRLKKKKKSSTSPTLRVSLILFNS